MPIFEYACRKCGKAFEKLVLSRTHKAPECPECGSKRVEQKFSTFATAGAAAKPSMSSRACAPSGAG